ncbi:MAG: hypothetical protein HY075_02775 [Deltaproteobacteria bacterium]|nr:hypothetical protein [Deltaproteobacteria bacterium]
MKQLLALVLALAASTATTTRARADFHPIFNLQPTREAGQRSDTLERGHDEKLHYQTGGLRDELDYVQSKRDLARWYFTALLRAELSGLFRKAKHNYQFERDRQRSQAPARREPAGTGAPSPGERPAAVPASSGASFAPAAEAETHDDWVELLERMSRFVERLTNGGLETRLSSLQARLHLDTRSSVIDTRVSAPLVSIGASFRLLPDDRSVPFSGSGGGGGERLVLTGDGVVPGLWMHGAVQYQHVRRSFGCVVSRQIVAGLSGEVARSWSLASATEPESRASLSLSVAF